MKANHLILNALDHLVKEKTRVLEEVETHGERYDVYGDEVSLMLYSRALGKSIGLDSAILKLRSVLCALDSEV